MWPAAQQQHQEPDDSYGYSPQQAYYARDYARERERYYPAYTPDYARAPVYDPYIPPRAHPEPSYYPAAPYPSPSPYPYRPPPPPDSSVPLVMLCRALTLDAFLVEKPKYASLELRWVPLLDDLHADLRAASLQHPSIQGSRRRVFCSAVGGPEDFITDVRRSLRGEDADMEWREVTGLVELRRELERVNERWARTVAGAEERMREREEREKCRREGREYVPLPPMRARSWSAELAESGKRAREGTDSMEPEAKRLPERKFLDTILKRPRRDCRDWASKRGVIIDGATEVADEEPVIGERVNGIWHISDQPLGQIQPQIQVLMARYLRDAFNPPRLRLYESGDANKVLKDTVPWFHELINQAKERFDEILVGPQSPVLSPADIPSNPYADYAIPTPTSHVNSLNFPESPRKDTSTSPEREERATERRRDVRVQPEDDTQGEEETEREEHLLYDHVDGEGDERDKGEGDGQEPYEFDVDDEPVVKVEND